MNRRPNRADVSRSQLAVLGVPTGKIADGPSSGRRCLALMPVVVCTLAVARPATPPDEVFTRACAARRPKPEPQTMIYVSDSHEPVNLIASGAHG